MTTQIDSVSYRGWGHVARIANKSTQLLVLTQVGPRIAFYGSAGGGNQLHEFDEHMALASDGQYHGYAGHRLWVSPEVERTYYPDNFPVEVSPLAHGLRFTAPPETTAPGTGLQKELEVRLAPEGTHVTLLHRITNRSRAATEMAPWALTVMEGGGRAILPLPLRQPMSKQHLLPEGVIGLWSYTDLADPRWKFGTKYLQLKTEAATEPTYREQMLGFYNASGWAAYFRDRHLFVKRAEVQTGKTYPDFGCNFETYTEPGFLELETLGPLRTLKAGETAEHIEHWWLFNDVPEGEGDAWVDEVILPRVEGAFTAKTGTE